VRHLLGGGDNAQLPAERNYDAWVEAFIDAGAQTLAEVRRDWSREREIIRAESHELMNDFDARLARLEGRIDVLMSMMQGKGQVVDPPPLPKVEASTERTIVRKVKVTR
jgi:hypothetical protein